MTGDLDPIVHSLRWHHDRIVARAWRSLWKWREIHYGDRPDFLEIAPFLRYDLLRNLAAMRSYAVQLRERDFTLFGIPVRVVPSASGFQWAPGRVRASYTLSAATDAPDADGEATRPRQNLISPQRNANLSTSFPHTGGRKD